MPVDTVTPQPDTAALRAVAAARIPGYRGIWVGIFCVLVEFMLLFGVYFVARVHNPEDFRLGPDALITRAGVAITVFLLSSGYCMVKAVEVMRQGRHRTAARWVLAAILLGLGYPVIKYFELDWYTGDGGHGRGGVFYGAYYYLTLTHLVHVSWGLLGLIWVGIRSALGGYSADNYGGLEAAAMYWHTTDILWLAIFPLFYVLR